MNISQDKLTISASEDERFSLVNTNLSEMQSTVLTTTTNEPFMMMRLYYAVYNKVELLNVLDTIECICLYDNYKFVINYHHETKDIGLAVKHNKAPKNLPPIVLAKGKIIDETSMVIDLRSFERGCCIIEFIDRYIKRDVAELTHIATYNKMHLVTKKTIPAVMNIDYDELFSENNIHRPDIRFDKLMSDAKEVDSLEGKQELMLKFMHESVTEKPHLIEKYPAHYYEDGISSIRSILKFRQRLAQEHLMGNTSMNMFQLIKKIIPDVLEDDGVPKELSEFSSN